MKIRHNENSQANVMLDTSCYKTDEIDVFIKVGWVFDINEIIGGISKSPDDEKIQGKP